MSNRKAPRSGNANLVKLIANVDAERTGFMAIQAHEANKRRQEKFGERLKESIFLDIAKVVRSETGSDVFAHARAKQSGVANGGIAISDKPIMLDPPVGIETYDRRALARDVASFEAEHTFLFTIGRLVGLSRRAIDDIGMHDPSNFHSEIKMVLENTAKALRNIQAELPGYKPTPKRKILMPGETLDHNKSIEFLAEALGISLNQSIVIVGAINDAILETVTVTPTESPKETTRTPEWVRAIIAKLIEMLQNLVKPRDNKSLPASVTPEEPKTPRIILAPTKTLELCQTSIAILLRELENRPGFYLSQHLEILKDLATAAQAAKDSLTTPQK